MEIPISLSVQVEQIFGGVTGLPDGTEVVIRLISTTGDLQGENVELVNQVFVVGVDDPILLLDGSGSIPVGGQGVIELVVEFTLPEGTVSETFELSSLAAGVDENGVAVSDESDNGSATDANGNGPEDDSDPTPLSIASTPIIGVIAKVDQSEDGSTVRLLDAGDATASLETRQLTYGAGFEIEVANLGNTTLENVEVVNSLVSTFPTLASDPDQPLRVVPGSIV